MTTDIKERLRAKAAWMEEVDFVICAKLYRDAADYIEQQQIEIDTLRHGLRLANDARSDLEAKLSAQTAEPVAWMMITPSQKHHIILWDQSEVDRYKGMGDRVIQALYTHPAKTEQPILNEEFLTVAEQIALAALLTPLSVTELRVLLAQRQDSNKDAERYRFMREDTRVGIEIEGRELSHEYLDAAIDRAIANGAPK